MGGPRLEIFKFSLYVSMPVAATWLYSQPETMHLIVRKLNYIVYPAVTAQPPMGDEMVALRPSVMARGGNNSTVAPKKKADDAVERRWWQVWRPR